MENILETWGPILNNTISVLLVDDSEVIIHGLKGILKTSIDISVVGVAYDGYDAVDEALKLRPDVIVLDAQMPHMDGVDAAKFIKQSLPETRIIFMAVHDTRIDEAVLAGADSYLMKDCNRSELLREIRRLGPTTTRSVNCSTQ